MRGLARRGAGALAALLVFAAICVTATARPAFAHTPHDSISDVEMSPNYEQDGTVYTISREWLLKSTDRGETWKRLERGLDNRSQFSSIEVAARDGNVLYAASHGDGMFRSDDAGETWVRASNGLAPPYNVAVLAASPHSTGEVWAAYVEEGLFKTTDGGGSWQAVSGIPVLHVTAVAFAPDSPGVVAVGDGHGGLNLSEDGGQTWRSVPLGSDGAAISAIAFSPDYANDKTFFVGTSEGGVFKTTDGGGSYQSSSNGLTDLRIISLHVSPTYTTDSTVWTTVWSTGAYRTNDAGANWTLDKPGLTTNAQADLLKRPQFGQLRGSRGAPGVDPTLFVAGFDGLFRSEATGNLWTEVQTQSSTDIQAIALSPNYAEDHTLAVTTYINGVFLSQDDGASFRAINKGLAARFEWVRRADYVARLMGAVFSPTYAEDTTMFNAGRGYWFISRNSGELWRPTSPSGVLVKNEFPPDYFLSVFSPDYANDKTVMLATDGGKVFKSTDGGRRFTKLTEIEFPNDSLVISPEFATDDTVVAGTPDGVYKSTDAGETWSKTGDLPRPTTSLAISPGYGTDKTLFAGTRRGLFSSTDAGATWTRITGAPFGELANIESVVVSPDFVDDGTVLVSARGVGLFKSTDGGKTFAATGQNLLESGYVLSNFYHPTSEPIVFSPSYATDQTVWGFAENQVFKSSDGAATWEPVTIPVTEHDTAIDAAPNELLSVPRFGQANTQRDRAEQDDPLDFSAKSIGASLVAGLIVFGALTVLPVFRKSRFKWLIRIGAGVVVFAAALAILAVT